MLTEERKMHGSKEQRQSYMATNHMKLLLPLLLIAFSGFAQDAPKLDPNTGLPTSGNNKNAETTEEREARYFFPPIRREVRWVVGGGV